MESLLFSYFRCLCFYSCMQKDMKLLLRWKRIVLQVSVARLMTCTLGQEAHSSALCLINSQGCKRKTEYSSWKVFCYLKMCGQSLPKTNLKLYFLFVCPLYTYLSGCGSQRRSWCYGESWSFISFDWTSHYPSHANTGQDDSLGGLCAQTVAQIF